VLAGPFSLVPVVPAAYSNLSLLCASASSNVVIRAIIRHTDSALNEVKNLVVYDWTTNAVQPAWDAMDAINVDSKTNIGRGIFALFSIDMPCNPASPVTSVDVSWNKGIANSHVAVFALSGAAVNPGTITVLPFHITSEKMLSPSQFKITWDSVSGAT